MLFFEGFQTHNVLILFLFSIKTLYENKSFIGDIKYVNTVLKEYNMAYSDKISDYLTIDDFGGIQVILLSVCSCMSCMRFRVNPQSVVT